MTTIKGIIDSAAEDWDVSPAVVIWLLAIPFVLPVVTIAAGVLHRPTFDLLTGEDRLGEWLQEAAWIGAIVFTAMFMTRLLQAKERLLTVLYGVFLCGMVFIAGEEISWGQRIVGFSTPDSLVPINRQGESNLHNILGVQTMFSWGMFLVGAYGSIMPCVALRKWGSYRHWPLFVRLLSPHWLLIPFFGLMLVWRIYRNLFEPLADYYYAISQFGETTELVLASAFLLFAWHQWKNRSRLTGSDDRPLPEVTTPVQT